MALAIYPTDTDQPPTLHEPATSGFQIHRYRLTQGKQAGCELIIINSQSVCAAICPTRGMSLWRAKLDGIDCEWGSPVRGPVHPCFVPISEAGGLGWLDGFDELLVRCGLRSFGAPDFDGNGKLLHPLHGSIGNLPAENVEINLSDDGERLIVSGDVYETRFLIHNLKLRVEYEFTLGQPSITVRDTVSNIGGAATTAQLLYHINFGKPLLDAGCEFHCAADEVVARDNRAAEDLATWNQYLGPTEGYAEQVYFLQPVADENGWATTVLSNPKSKQAAAVHYKTGTLPYFTLWKNTASEATGYVTGLEPGTGFPNPRSYEEKQGRLVELQPGESRSYELKIEATQDPQAIRKWLEKINLSQGNLAAKQTSFNDAWCTPRS